MQPLKPYWKSDLLDRGLVSSIVLVFLFSASFCGRWRVGEIIKDTTGVRAKKCKAGTFKLYAELYDGEERLEVVDLCEILLISAAGEGPK